MMATESARRQSITSSTADAVRINLSGTKYSVVRTAAEEVGMVAAEDGSGDCNVLWVDGAVPLEKYLELKSYQRINHFPGMGEISRKDSLARNIQRIQRINPSEYNFFPATWVLPADYGSLASHLSGLRKKKRRKTFIVKPHNGAMGNGIFLTRSPDTIPQQDKVIVQEYLEKPFLLDGFKCDLRVYVLVTSCNPLRIFVYKDGLVRLSTEEYSPPSDSNLDRSFMHLTNYSVNRHSDSFNPDKREDRGSKRTLRSFIGWLSRKGHNIMELWAKIYDVIIKTLILAHPHLLHSYTVCRPGRGPDERSQFFEVLGFDIMLDHNLRPWLLEVNRSPSFGTDAPLDLQIKTGVIRDALRLANIRPSDKHRDVVAQKVASRRRLYTPPRSSHSALDFQAEQVEAAGDRERKRQEVKEKLSRLRREKELEEYEEVNKGDYVRVYPTCDPFKARSYSRLMGETLKTSALGRSASSHSTRPGYSASGRGGSGCGQAGGVGEMKEHELLDLLSQYEEDVATPTWYSGFSQRPSTSSFQPLALQDSSPMGNMYSAMAARMQEEEQTQRTMIALNEMAPFYPGKDPEEVERVLKQIHSEFAAHKANICSFWLVTLDNAKRKQLLAPVREAVKCLLHCHWRRADLRSVRLHHITTRLMAFLVGRGGEGLWASIEPLDKSSSWEVAFKKKQDVISVTEMVCCRRIVELCQATLMAAYHYHCLRPRAKHKSPSSSVPPTKCPSLPHLKGPPSLTAPSLAPPPTRPLSHSLSPSPYLKPVSTHRHSRRRLY